MMKENIQLPWLIDKLFCILKENKTKGLVALIIPLKRTFLYIRERRRAIVLKKFMKMELRNRREIFTYIYRHDKWGKSEDPDLKYYSGIGSDTERTKEYIDLVNSFVSKHNVQTIVDCGCGDFRVASNFQVEKYIGVDVCSELIDYNNEKFATNNIKFLHLDIIEDEIPNADLCLIRLLLQHLSNSDILKLLPKLNKFEFVLMASE